MIRLTNTRKSIKRMMLAAIAAAALGGFSSFNQNVVQAFDFDLQKLLGQSNQSSQSNVLQAVASTDWYMSGANPQRTSHSEATIDPSKLAPAWSTVIDPHIPNKAQIIAANDTLFVSSANGLYALDSATGSQKWFYATNMPLGNSPTYFVINFSTSNKRVYVGGFDKKIHAVDAVTGKAIWTFDQAEAGYDTNPLVLDINGKVYIYVGNRDGNQYAIEDSGNSGILRWKYQTAGPIHFSTAYKSPNVYFASNDAYAYAINATSGSLVWKSSKLPTADGFHSWWPVISGEYVILGNSRGYRPGSGPQLGVGDVDADNLPKLDGTGVVLNAQGTRVTYPAYTPNQQTVPTNRVASMVNAINYLENMPWRRSYYFLNIADGSEKTFDLDKDGKTDYAPLMNTGTNNGTRYPAMIGPDPNSSSVDEIYTFNNFAINDYTQGVAGWKIGNTFVTTPSNGQSNGDEPMAYSGAGDLVFVSQCCDRSASVYNAKTGQNWNLYSYDLGNRFPNYGIKATGSAESNAVRLFGDSNGIYGYHGTDQNPLIPYVDSKGVGRVYLQRSNAILAFSTGASGTATNRVISSTQPAVNPPAINVDDLKQKLAGEVTKIIAAGHLRPGYGVLASWTIRRQYGDRFHDYFNSPADTIYALTKAYENLPADNTKLKTDLAAYLQSELNNWSPCSVTHIGYSNGAAREDFILPPEVQDSIKSGVNNVSDGVLSPETNSEFWGGRSPFTYYALWKYASVLGDAKTATQLLSDCGDIGNPPSITSTRALPFVQNAWIAGLYGYMKLQVMAGQVNSINSSSKYSAYTSQLTDRANNFSASNTWGGPDSNNDLQYWAVARNFLYMTPELGQYLQTNALTKVQNAFNGYNYNAPYWFVTRFEETYSEGTMSFLYNYPAMFGAKAYVLGAKREELAQYLDVPAFARGDLFYIQNLALAIETPAIGTSTPATPTIAMSPTSGVKPTIAPLNGPTLGAITVNSLNTVPQYAKYEIEFPITNTSATNMYFPYTATTPANSGVTPGIGISVDMVVTSPDNKEKTVPCFYYQPTEQVGSGTNIALLPTGNAVWRCRYAPETYNESGSNNWSYYIKAIDSKGTTSSATRSFSVSKGTSKGFVKVSNNDNRFFEFSNGQPFTSQLVNTEQSNFQSLAGIRSRIADLGNNGMRFVRWFPTEETGYLSLFGNELLIDAWHWGNHGAYTNTDDVDTVKGKRFSYEPAHYDATNSSGSFQDIPAIPGAKYRMSFRAHVTSPKTLRVLVSFGGTNQNYVDVTNNGGWNDYYFTVTNTSNSNSLRVILTDLNGVPGGSGTIRMSDFKLARCESGSCSDSNESTWGPNIVDHPDTDTYAYVDQVAAARMDEIMDLSEIYGVYHKLTLFHKNDLVLGRFQSDGSVNDKWSLSNFYNSPAAWWYEDAYVRYFTARWSYSTALHSLEFANENDPGNSQIGIDAANIVNSMSSRPVLMSNSYYHWNGLPATAWTDKAMAYADRHWYAASGSTDSGGPTATYSSQVSDAVAYVRDCLTFFKTYNSQNGINKPFVQGESGNATANVSRNDTAYEATATWNHKQLWTGVGVLGYSCGGEWWPNFDLMYPSYKAYDAYLSNEQLNNGKHVEIGSDLSGTANIVSSNSTLRAFGSKDISTGRILVWVDNKNNTIQNVDNRTGASGTITINTSDFPQSTYGNYAMEIWDTRTGKSSVVNSVASVGAGGVLQFNVSNLTTDVAYKFYNTTSTPQATPSVTPTPRPISTTTPSPIPTITSVPTPTLVAVPTATIVPTPITPTSIIPTITSTPIPTLIPTPTSSPSLEIINPTDITTLATNSNVLIDFNNFSSPADNTSIKSDYAGCSWSSLVQGSAWGGIDTWNIYIADGGNRGVINFPRPVIVKSIVVGSQSSNSFTLSSSGNPDATTTTSGNNKIVLTTGWKTPVTSVNLISQNNDQAFDDLRFTTTNIVSPTPTIVIVPTVNPTIVPTVILTPTVRPTATPVPTLRPTATPIPTVRPTATPVPTLRPTATPIPTVRPSGTLTPTVPTILGDLDGDGHVNKLDLAIFIRNFGKTGKPGFISSDIIKDGKVNIFDYNVLVRNYGK